MWAGGKKIASLGVGVRRWISMHGFAMNVTANCLLPFFAITPCGIEGVVMSCVEQEAGRPVSVEEFADAFVPHYNGIFDTKRGHP